MSAAKDSFNSLAVITSGNLDVKLSPAALKSLGSTWISVGF